MSEENKSFFGQIKNQLIATIGLIITAAGGIVIANMEAIFGVKEEVEVEQPSMEQTIVIPETTKDTIVISKTIIQPPPEIKEEKEYDW
jgi:hypothetical protein